MDEFIDKILQNRDEVLNILHGYEDGSLNKQESFMEIKKIIYSPPGA